MSVNEMITVHITEDNIQEGERESCTKCPVALALEREFYLREGNAMVFDEEFSLDRGRTFYPLPKEIRHWVHYYDQYGQGMVGPISFTIEDPYE